MLSVGRRRTVGGVGVAAVAVAAVAVAVVAVAVAAVVQRPWADDARDNDPVGLVGLWRVSEVGDETEQAWLLIGDDNQSLDLWRSCGRSDGAWDAGRTAFIASIGGSTAGCAYTDDGAGFAPAWLWQATAYAATDDGWQLLDRTGAVLATLSAGAPPDFITEAIRREGEPVVTDALRAELAEPVPLPTGLTPATADDLMGRWVPARGASANGPHVTFDDGGWQGSDGCNGTQGRWTVEPGGRLFLASTMETTLEDCGGDRPGDGVVLLLPRVARVGLDDDELVLVNASGTELARLVRD